MNDNEVLRRIQAVLEHCKKLTLGLVRLAPSSKEIAGLASGFFINVDGAVYLLSAGHALEEEGWVIETTFTEENEFKVACIPIGGAWIMKRIALGSSKMEDVDIAWAKVDFEAFKQAVFQVPSLKGKSFEYMVYQGPVDNTPKMGVPHIYAAANRATLHSALGRKHLERDYSFEYEMEYKSTRPDGLYVFSIPKHKGHKYYRGASGAPIIEPSGKIVAVLVGGCETKNELYGTPLNGIINFIKIGIDVESSEKSQ
jgi:hypothetical protein